MKTTDIFYRIKNVIKEITGCDRIDKTDRLKEELGLDSLSLVVVILALENEFTVTFASSNLSPDEILTVDDLINLVEKSQ